MEPASCIAWSTERVFRQTLDRARELRLDPVVLPEWYDVDDRAALRRLIAELDGPGAATAPHTAALLRRFAGKL